MEEVWGMGGGSLEEIYWASGGVENECGAGVDLHDVLDEEDESVFVDRVEGVPESVEFVEAKEFCGVQVVAVAVGEGSSGVC